jgi:hypothetical protein
VALAEVQIAGVAQSIYRVVFLDTASKQLVVNVTDPVLTAMLQSAQHALVKKP